MATSKPQASICYNTDRFLKKTLQGLVDNGVLEWWFYIEHEPDTDDKMKHKHLWVKPRKTIDMVDLEQHFYQYQKGKKEPLRCIGFEYSEPKNAILYFLHDKDFLKAKKKTRNKHYKYAQFKTSDKLKLEYQYRCAVEWLHSDLMQTAYTEDQIKVGKSLCQLAQDGLINSSNAFRMKQYQSIVSDKLDSISTEDKELHERLTKEYDDIRQLKKELSARNIELNKRLEALNIERKNYEIQYKQLALELQNPWEGGVINGENKYIS